MQYALATGRSSAFRLGSMILLASPMSRPQQLHHHYHHHHHHHQRQQQQQQQQMSSFSSSAAMITTTITALSSSNPCHPSSSSSLSSIHRAAFHSSAILHVDNNKLSNKNTILSLIFPTNGSSSSSSDNNVVDVDHKKNPDLPPPPPPPPSQPPSSSSSFNEKEFFKTDKRLIWFLALITLVIGIKTLIELMPVMSDNDERTQGMVELFKNEKNSLMRLQFLHTLTQQFVDNIIGAQCIHDTYIIPMLVDNLVTENNLFLKNSSLDSIFTLAQYESLIPRMVQSGVLAALFRCATKTTVSAMNSNKTADTEVPDMVPYTEDDVSSIKSTCKYISNQIVQNPISHLLILVDDHSMELLYGEMTKPENTDFHETVIAATAAMLNNKSVTAEFGTRKELILPGLERLKQYLDTAPTVAPNIVPTTDQLPSPVRGHKSQPTTTKSVKDLSKDLDLLLTALHDETPANTAAVSALKTPKPQDSWFDGFTTRAAITESAQLVAVPLYVVMKWSRKGAPVHILRYAARLAFFSTLALSCIEMASEMLHSSSKARQIINDRIHNNIIKKHAADSTVVRRLFGTEEKQSASLGLYEPRLLAGINAAEQISTMAVMFWTFSRLRYVILPFIAMGILGNIDHMPSLFSRMADESKRVKTFFSTVKDHQMQKQQQPSNHSDE